MTGDQFFFAVGVVGGTALVAAVIGGVAAKLARRDLKTWIVRAALIGALVGVVNAVANGGDHDGTGAATQAKIKPYFNKDRFYNPEVLKMLYEKKISRLKSLPKPATTPVLLYTMYAADQVEAQCGEFLSFESTTIRGVVRATVTIASVGGAIAAISAKSDEQATQIGNWVKGIDSIGTVEKQAKRDTKIFLQDQGACADRRVFQLQDGLDKFFKTSS